MESCDFDGEFFVSLYVTACARFDIRETVDAHPRISRWPEAKTDFRLPAPSSGRSRMKRKMKLAALNVNASTLCVACKLRRATSVTSTHLSTRMRKTQLALFRFSSRRRLYQKLVFLANAL